MATQATIIAGVFEQEAQARQALDALNMHRAKPLLRVALRAQQGVHV